MERVTGEILTSLVGGVLAFTCLGFSSCSLLPASPFIWKKKAQLSLDVIFTRNQGNRKVKGNG